MYLNTNIYIYQNIKNIFSLILYLQSNSSNPEISATIQSISNLSNKSILSFTMPVLLGGIAARTPVQCRLHQGTGLVKVKESGHKFAIEI